MKKFAVMMLMLSVAMFSFAGCSGEEEKKPDDKKPAETKPTDS